MRIIKLDETQILPIKITIDKPHLLARVSKKYPPMAQKIICKIINEYYDKSMITCEYCGKKGKLRETGWWKTLSDEWDKSRYDSRKVQKWKKRRKRW